jgi:hypothetical protein
MGFKRRKSEPYWKEWREVWMAPLYGGDSGAPFIVLAYDMKNAFEQARARHPTAGGWEMQGFVDPKDRECVLARSPKAKQFLVTRVK